MWVSNFTNANMKVVTLVVLPQGGTQIKIMNERNVINRAKDVLGQKFMLILPVSGNRSLHSSR